MKLISLTQGKFAQIDDADYEDLSKYKWCAHKGGKTYYVERQLPMINGKQGKIIYMHRVIMNAKKGEQVDHINGNGLNNQKYNLRFATTAQNQHNQHGPPKHNTSDYKGVSWSKWHKKYRAQIGVDKKVIHLGWFISKIEAAFTYNRAAIKYYGEFACLNEI